MSYISESSASSEDLYCDVKSELVVPTRFLFSVAKHVFDKSFALLALPILIFITLAVWALNVRFNPGPTFYRQKRMGKHGEPFVMWKFRTMLPDDGRPRCHTEGVETHRVTPFGRIMRKYRIDELPNLINVLRSEMSIVGPRPDLWNHAKVYCDLVPGYQERHLVRPGITGLAQVDMGYAEGVDATAKKAFFDHRYIRDYGFRQELRIVAKTLMVVVTGAGAL